MPFPSSQALLIRNCGQLLTLAGPRRARRGREMREIAVLRNAAVLIQDGKILRVDRDRVVARSPEAQGSREIDAGRKVVLPGFVDSHTHALFASGRVEDYVARIEGASYVDLARRGGGIRASARHLAASSAVILRRRLEHSVRWFLDHGTTTAEVKSGYGLALQQELKMLRVIRDVARRGPLDLVATLLVHDVPDEFRPRRASFIRQIVEHWIPCVARQRLAQFFDVFTDVGYFSLGETRRLLAAASRFGLQLKLHAEQLAATGAARLAVAFRATSMDHLDCLRLQDVRGMRGTDTIATLLPGSILHLGAARQPPARALVEAAVPLALATNFNPGSSPTPNMQLILSLACSQLRLLPEEAITAATINGAYAVGRGATTGSLEPGKAGDCCIMDVDDYREIPYYFGVNHCRMVVRRGQVVADRTGGRR